jgi:small GTP-binding protein
VKPATSNDTLRAKASQLAHLAAELGLEPLAETIRSDTRRRLADARVRIVVLGEIKQGKSTLVNALVQRDAMPVGVTPTTGAVVTVRAGDGSGPRLVDASGSAEALDTDRFKSLVVGREVLPADHGLEYIVAEDALPTAVELIDTPGMNDMARVRGAMSRGELPRADVLVLVLDATQLLNRSEMAFLRDAVAAVGGLAESGAKLLLVINRIDLIAQDDRPRLVEHLRREVAAVAADVPEDRLEIFQTDARGATRNPEDAAPAIVDVARLRARLFEIAGAAEGILPARTRASLLRHATLLGHNAAIASRAASLELDDLRREIRAVEKEIVGHQSDLVLVREKLGKAREQILATSAGRVAEFRESLVADALRQLESIDQRAMTSYLPESLKDATLAFVREESERLRESLDEVTVEALRTHGEQARRRLFRAAMRLGFRAAPLYIEPPSVALEAGLLAIGLAGTVAFYFGSLPVGLSMTIAGPLASVVLRERSLRSARRRAREILAPAIHRAVDDLQQAIAKVVTRHVAALEEHLVLANLALGQQLAGVLAQARARLGDDDDGLGSRREAAVQRYREIELTIGEVRRELESVALS